MLKPNRDYRANPQRAIFLQGRIEQQLIDRLTPEIIKLQGVSRDPITVYIDSPGGSTLAAETLSNLLRASDQNFAASCRLITVVTGLAASAAADILCSGEFAIALPDAVILFHGVRNRTDGQITETDAAEMMESLRQSNDRYALALADRSLRRFGFRYVSERARFSEYRTKVKKPTLSDLFCFVGIIQERLSKDALRAVDRAFQRNGRYLDLVRHIAKRVAGRRKFMTPQRAAEPEAEIMKAIVDYELSRNKNNPAWTFGSGGLRQMNVDFLLVREYLNIYDSQHLRQLCELYGNFLLSQSDILELEAKPEPEREKARQEKLKEVLRPLWLFFIALCYALQETDNQLTAEDAYWLGLIDEIMGRQDLESSRLTIEALPDAQLELPEPPPAAV